MNKARIEALKIVILSVVLGLISTLVAQVLVQLIAGVTNFAFMGQLSLQPASPANHIRNYGVIVIPVIGSFFVGILARFGSKAIRGHGIPEAMEQILLNESKIPFRIAILKPLSAAIAIGTGGPFGAEGPIIATGGALGSALGQILKLRPYERKILLAAGAAAGMTAIFGSPVSAIFLTIELLLFEYNAKSFIPVAVATAVATAFRSVFFGFDPAFQMPDLPTVHPSALLSYGMEGIIIGLFSVIITKSLYFIEDQFEKLPIHWMWWPMIGGLAVGIVGFFSPATLGVGYDNIEKILSGTFVGWTLLFFCLLKFLSWSIALGSGTSGGTLAPIFTIGGGGGVLIGSAMAHFAPGISIDLRIAALVGMAGCFAGASRALFTSIIFAFETTRQPNSLGPLLVGCTLSYVVSSLLMKHTIMTEKLARRGHHVPTKYAAV